MIHTAFLTGGLGSIGGNLWNALLAGLTAASVWVIPAVICLCGVIMLTGRRDWMRIFTDGAAEGLRTAVRLLPSLSAMLVGVGMLRASGALDAVSSFLAPFLSRVGIPGELTPLLLTRPFSGSASLAVLEDLLGACGPDSLPALCACVLAGSSDTAVYVLSIYFSSVGVRRTRWALPCALAVMIFCVVLSCLVCRLMFA